MKQNKQLLSILALIFVAFFYTLLNITVRLMNQGLANMTQVYLRVFLGLLIGMLVFGRKIKLTKLRTVNRRDWFWLLLMGTIAYSVPIYFLTMASLNTKLVNVSVIYAIIPFVVYVYSYFFLKEKIKPMLILLIAVSIYGVAIVSTKKLIPTFSQLNLGDLYAFVAVLFAGFWSLSRKMLSNKLNNQEISLVVMFFAALSGFIIALVKKETLNSQAFFNYQVLLGLCLGSVLNITSTYFENFAFGNINIVIGNQVLMLESLFSLILGLMIYREMVVWPEIVGAGLILVSVYISNKKFLLS